MTWVRESAPPAPTTTWVGPSVPGPTTGGERAAGGDPADGLGERAAVGEAVGRVLGQRPLDQQPHGRRDVRPAAAAAGRLMCASAMATCEAPSNGRAPERHS